MEVNYNKGRMYPVEIANGERAVLISIDDAKKLQEKLTSVLRQADLERKIDEEWEPYDQMGFDLTKSQFTDIAYRFYELGKNSK